MEKEQVYIRERIYLVREEKEIDLNKKEQWEKILGVELLENLIEKCENIKAFLCNKEYMEKFNNKYYEKLSKEYVQEKLNIKNNKGEFYRNILMSVRNKINKKNKDNVVYSNYLEKQILERIENSLKILSYRILIAIENDNNTASEDEIYQKYPLLKRCLWEVAIKQEKFYSELIKRIEENKDEIEMNILGGKKFGKIQRIEQNIADKHCGGKQVLQIELDNGERIIYKPHNIQNEVIFNQILNKIGEQCGIDMYCLKILSYKDYGWEECVIKKECNSEDEVKQFYFRIGIILFVAYILGTNDIHCENLIANGKYPVIVDMESISTGIPTLLNNLSLSEQVLQESVLKVGILPYYSWGKKGKGTDLSSLAGGGGEIYSFKMPIIKKNESGKKYISYDFARLPEAKNRVCLNGEIVSPKTYEQDIQEGFECAYKVAFTNRKSFKKKLKGLQLLSSRYLVSHTQKYTMLLDSSYHPKVMKNAGDRELLLHVLWDGRSLGNETDQKIVDAEIFDILNGDIPVFHFYLNKTSLYDSRGNEIKNFFFHPPIEQIYHRIKHLSVIDLKRQKLFIHLSLSAAGTEKRVKECIGIEFEKIVQAPQNYSREVLVQTVKGIMKHLIEQGIYDPIDNTMSWYSLSVFSNECGALKLYPCDMYLYNGIAGITLFVNMVSNYFVEEIRYIDMAKLLIQQIQSYTNNQILKSEKVFTNKSGLFNGEGSIVWVYLLLYELDKQKEYLNYAEKHAEYLFRVAQTDKANDLLDGKAGAVAAFCLLYRATKNGKYLKYACEVADKVIEEAVIMEIGVAWEQPDGERPLLGMAHGNAGILLVFAELYQLTRNEKYYNIFQKTLEYEDANYNSEEGDWQDFRSVDKILSKGNQMKTMSWCHGAGGILLSRLLLLDYSLKEKEKEIIRQDIQRAVCFIQNAEFRNDMCLCHGMCGNRMILEVYKKRCGKELVCKEYNGNEKNKILTKEWYNPGVMNGYSGIGLYLLKILKRR